MGLSLAQISDMVTSPSILNEHIRRIQTNTSYLTIGKSHVIYMKSFMIQIMLGETKFPIGIQFIQTENVSNNMMII